MQQMSQIIEESFSEGAYGLPLGLGYEPGMYKSSYLLKPHNIKDPVTNHIPLQTLPREELGLEHPTCLDSSDIAHEERGMRFKYDYKS